MDWLHEFRPGSALHYGTLAWCLAAMVGFAWWGRSLADPRHEQLLRRGWVVVMALVSAVVLSIAWLPANFDARYSLPLHLCDLAIVIAGVSLWTRQRLARSLTYFWTLGLSTQAFVTPIVLSGPAHPEYWFFWILHVQVVGAAVYDLAVHRFRPTRRDFLQALGVTLLYGVVVTPIDLAWGWNYGFLGRDERLGAGTLLEYLPPWPQRLPVMFALAASGMALLWLVWPAARWLRTRLHWGDAARHRP